MNFHPIVSSIQCMRCAGISQHIFLIVALLWIPQASIGATKSEPKAILFLGDSLTAGYGLDRSKAYPALIQGEIDSRGWKFRVINAGQSGDTSAGGLDRLGWLLKQRIKVLVLELGANDGLRGLPVEVTRRNLQAIIDRTKAKYPGVRVVIAEMQVPPNMGREYGDRFKAIFSDLAERNRAVLIPFLLDGVGGVPELNLPDGIHPTARGHERVAQNVWSVLEPLLRALRNGSES